MARGNPDCCAHQLMTQYCCHLHWHQVSRLTQVRSDEDLKMSIFAALIIPALAMFLLRRPLDVNPMAIRSCAGSGASNLANMGAMHLAT